MLNTGLSFTRHAALLTVARERQSRDVLISIVIKHDCAHLACLIRTFDVTADGRGVRLCTTKNLHF